MEAAFMRSELRINGTYVDISDEVAMHLTFAISDIKNPDKRQGAFSKTVKLPGTDSINRLLTGIFEISLNIQNTSTTNFNPDFNPNLKASCIVSCDSVEQFRGYMRLRSIERDRTNLELLHYNVELYGDVSTIFTTLADHKLSELSISEYNHTYNSTNQINSWSLTYTNGYYYPMIQYGNTDGINWGVDNFFPAVYLKIYIDKIFAYAGASYTSSFLTSSPFTELIIPYNGVNLQLTTSQVDARKFEAKTSALTDNIYTTLYQPFVFDNETSDPSNQYNPATGEFTAANTGTYEFYVNGSMYFHAVTGVTLSNTGAGAYIYVWRTSGSSVTLIGSTNLVNNFTVGSLTAGQDGSTLNFAFTTPTTYILAGDIIRVFVHPYASVSSGTLNFRIDNGFLFKNTINQPRLYEGGTIDMNAAIPEDIRMADLLADVIKMFNLMVEPDRTQPNKYLIEPASTFYGSGTTKDWTSKLDVSKTLEVFPMGALDARRYRMTYKPDADAYNKQYSDRWGDVYGVKKYDVNNDFLKNESVYESIFSPTPLVNNGADDRVYPYIYTLDSSGNAKQSKSNIRILYNAGLFTTSNAWNYITASGTTTQNFYPYAGHLDSLVNPTLDLSFGVPREVYYNATAYTDGNIWNTYHSRYIGEITDKDSKLITAWFYLNPVDILQLSFRDVIYVDGNYYRLQKVSDYNPSANATTKCELLKIKAHSNFLTGTYPFSPSSNAMLGLDAAPSILTSPTPQSRGQGVFIAGRENVANDTNSGSYIGGYRNNIGYGSQRINIFGSSGVTVYAGLTNVTVLNTNDITVTESNVAYIDGVKITGQTQTYNVSTSQTITGAGVYYCAGTMTLTMSQSVLRTGDIIQCYNMGTGTVTFAGGGINFLYAPATSSATIVSATRYSSYTFKYNGSNYILQ